MVFLIAIGICLLIIGIAIWSYKGADGFQRYQSRTVIYIMLFIILVCVAFGSVVTHNYNKYKSVGHKYSDKATLGNDIDVYSLQDNISTEGNLFFTFGNIDSDLYYYYATKDNNGKITIHKIKSTSAEIYEIGKDEKAHIEEYVYKEEGPTFFAKLFSFPFFRDDTNFTETALYKLYVPKGSMQENVNIDLK